MSTARTGTTEKVRFVHLGCQCPYTLWFADQARCVAHHLGLPFADEDVTGRPRLAAAAGAFCSMQVIIPGHSPRTAPRPADRIIAELDAGPLADCIPARGLLVQEPLADWSIYRPGSAEWPVAVAATGRLCLGKGAAATALVEAVAAKRSWLESVHAATPTPGCLLLIAGPLDAPTGFAELIPIAAGHIPVADAAPDDQLLTCVHSIKTAGGGDFRQALLERIAAVAGTIWAVAGRSLPYPNGPLSLMLAAGFREVATLGRHVLPGHCVDELVLVRRVAEALGPPTAAAVLVHPDDDVVTLPDGGDAGMLISAPGVPTVIYTACAVPPGHKVAIRHVAAGDYVLKYGQPIGRATKTITVGDHVHTHNLASARAGGPGPTNAKDGGK